MTCPVSPLSAIRLTPLDSAVASRLGATTLSPSGPPSAVEVMISVTVPAAPSTPIGILHRSLPVRAERADMPEKTDGAKTRPRATATVP